MLRYSATRAIWLSAIIFAVFHLNPWQAVIALPAGLFFGWLTLRTASIIPAIIGHMFVNATPNLLMRPLLWLFGYGSELDAMQHLPWPVVLFGAGLFAIGLSVVLMLARGSVNAHKTPVQAARTTDVSADRSIT